MQAMGGAALQLYYRLAALIGLAHAMRRLGLGTAVVCLSFIL